jgi:cell division septation protein DedD
LKKSGVAVLSTGLLLILVGFVLVGSVVYGSIRSSSLSLSSESPTYITLGQSQSYDITVTFQGQSQGGFQGVTVFLWTLDGSTVMGPSSEPEASSTFNFPSGLSIGEHSVICYDYYTNEHVDFVVNVISGVVATPTPMPQVTLTVDSVGVDSGGTYPTGLTNPSPGTYTFNVGSQATLTAWSEDSSWVFAFWQFQDGTALNQATIHLTFTLDVTATAIFTPYVSPTPTLPPTPTPTPIPTPRPTATPTSTPTPTPYVSPTPTPYHNPTPTPTNTASSTLHLTLENLLIAALGGLISVAGIFVLWFGKRFHFF